jgi:cysteinyl-tRNA synthetase
MASHPYRKALNFTFEGLDSAATAIQRLRNFDLRLKTEHFPDLTDGEAEARVHRADREFRAAMDDDLNTAEALAAVFEYLRDTNAAMDQGRFGSGNLPAARAFLTLFDSVFDVLRPTVAAAALSDDEVDARIEERKRAKKARDFARADAIRNELLEQGIILEDTKDGVRWKRK